MEQNLFVFILVVCFLSYTLSVILLFQLLFVCLSLSGSCFLAHSLDTSRDAKKISKKKNKSK